MARLGTLGLVAAVAAAGLLSGCQTAKLPYDQRIVVIVQERSRENPVNVTVTVDGRPVFGPADLAPGTPPREILVHDPATEGAPKLSPGESHRISWKLHRNAPLGKTGHAELTIRVGQQVIKTASTKYVWPLLWTSGWLDIKFEQPGKTTAPPKGPAPR